MELSELDQYMCDAITSIDKYVTAEYGVRCPEYVAGCYCCEAWKVRDRIVRTLTKDINPEE